MITYLKCIDVASRKVSELFQAEEENVLWDGRRQNLKKQMRTLSRSD